MTRLTLEPYKYPRRRPSNVSFFLCSNSSPTENSTFRPPPVAAVWGIPKHRRGHPHLHHPQHAPPARGIEPRRSQSPESTHFSRPAIAGICDLELFSGHHYHRRPPRATQGEITHRLSPYSLPSMHPSPFLHFTGVNRRGNARRRELR
jgi:hypothetical protein